MPEPNKIPRPFADSGDKNSIPDSSGALGFASWQEGFPAITGTPFAQGGVAPKRADFNGIFNALSQAVMWMQQGGVYAYDVNVDYEAGNVVLDSGGLYVAYSANGPSSVVVQPSSDTTGAAWYRLAKSNATGAVGNATQPVYLNSSGTITACGSTLAVDISGNATKATKDADGNIISSTYLNRAGGTMTGPLNFANGIWNSVGNDCKIGDFDKAGTLGIKGINSTPGLALVSQNDDTDYAQIKYDGTNVTSNKPISASNLHGKADEATRWTVVTGIKDIMTMTAGTMQNCEGTGFTHMPTGDATTHRAGTALQFGYTNDLNDWSRGFWLYTNWNNNDDLWIGKRISTTATNITWKQIGLVGTTCAPLPISNSGVGYWTVVDLDGESYTFPSGGTWVYYIHGKNSNNAPWGARSGIVAGGSTITIGSAIHLYGFIYRIV